jgi:hypothetical protein
MDEYDHSTLNELLKYHNETSHLVNLIYEN